MLHAMVQSFHVQAILMYENMYLKENNTKKLHNKNTKIIHVS